jgi:hypothetical protein
MKIALIYLLITGAISDLAFKFDSVDDRASIPDLGKGFKGISGLNGEDYSVTWKKGIVVTDGVSSSTYPSSDFAEILALSVARLLNHPKEVKPTSSEKYEKILVKAIVDSLNEYQFRFFSSLIKFSTDYEVDSLKLNNFNYHSSSTLISAQITNNEKKENILRVFQKGDSRLAVFRKTLNASKEGYYYKLHHILEEQQHYFNCPYQFQNLRNAYNVVNQKIFNLEIFKDDIIVAGSDGLFDNLFIGYLNHFINFLIYLSFEDNGLSQDSTEDKIMTQIKAYVDYLQNEYPIFIQGENGKTTLEKNVEKQIDIGTKARLFLENYKSIMTETEISTLEETLNIEKSKKFEHEKIQIEKKAFEIMKSTNELNRFEILLKQKETPNTKIKILSKPSSSKKIIDEIKPKKKVDLKREKNQKKQEEREKDIPLNGSELSLDHPTDFNKIFEVPISTFIDTKLNNEVEEKISNSFSFSEDNIEYFMKTIDSKTFSLKIAQIVKKMFEIDEKNNGGDKKRVLSPFFVEEYKNTKKDVYGMNMKIDDITVVTGFVVEDLKKRSKKNPENDIINSKLEESYEMLNMHAQEFAFYKVMQTVQGFI